MSHPFFKKTVCTLMAFTVGFTQTLTNVAVAQNVAAQTTPPTSSTTPPTSSTTPPTGDTGKFNINDYGKQANAFGKELGAKGKTGAPTFDGTSIKFSVGGKEMTLDKSELAPKPNGKNIRYAHTEEDFEKQKDFYNNGEAMDEKGSEQKDALFTDAESDNPTLEGEVYSVLVDMAKKEHSDYSEDLFLQKTEEILGDMENVLKDLVTCDAKSALDTQSKLVHVADYKECQQVVDKSMTCTIRHDYHVGVIQHSDGPFNIKNCGEGCTEVWIGNPSDQNFRAPSNQCVLYEQLIAIRLINPDAITSVSLVDVYWDDQMQIYFGEKGRDEVKLLQLPYPETFVPKYDKHPGVRPAFEYLGPYSGAPHESCQQRISWHWGTALDVTSYFKNATPDTIYNFRIRVAVMDNGEGYAKLRIHYDPKKVVSNDFWKPKDCIDAVLGIEDGMAEGTVKCLNMPTLDASGCAWIDGAYICEDALAESPINGISRFCREVEVTSKYVFNKGDTGCWKVLIGFDKDGNGIYEEVCGGQNFGGNLDTCIKYKDDPKCKFVSSECTEGMTGNTTGTCYVNDVVYDCGEDVKIEDVNAETKYECDGIACLGEDCIDVDRTQSTDFGKVNALLNALQYMAQDMECVGLDENGVPTGNQNVDCTVFGGNSGYCKIAVGGWQNCCDPVGGPGLAEYISMIQAGQRAHSATIAFSEAATEKMIQGIIGGNEYTPTLAEEFAGHYAEAAGQVKGVLMQGMDWLNKAFGSPIDNIYTFTDHLFSPLDWFKEAVLDKITEYCKEKALGILKDAGFENVDKIFQGGSGAEGSAENSMMQNALNNVFGEAVGNAIGSVVTFVGWVYLIYQVANLVIQLVYKCEEQEYKTVSQRDTKNCHYVGSYCKDKKLGMCIVKHRVYCCYQSPLSRIINEQIKATQPEILSNGGDWGNPKNPRCEGIPLGDINKINWDLINLDEWTALLVSTNNMVGADDINLDQLTGINSKINWTGSKGIATDWGIPKVEGQLDINRPTNSNGSGNSNSGNGSSATPPAQGASVASEGVSTFGLQPRAVKRDRLTTVDRIEDRLQEVHVDRLRIEGAPCIALDVGNQTVLRGGCGEMSNAAYICRHNGPLIDCEEVAFQNSLGELLGNKPTSEEYWNDGYRCYKGELSIDCSTLYSKDAYIKALEEFAKIIGGTTYLDRYVCLDKTGKFTQRICEHAMEQNYCGCQPGQFVCLDGNKPIACGALGENKNDCECMKGQCEGKCQYGGVPNGLQGDNSFACSTAVCPYGFSVGGQTLCNSATCAYGMK